MSHLRLTRTELFEYMVRNVESLDKLYNKNNIPKDPNSTLFQENIKRLYACFCEEMSELHQAINLNNKTDKNYRDAVLDELVDSGNFLLAILIHSNVHTQLTNFPKPIRESGFPASYTISGQMLNTITSMGIGCNQLKNRSWKESHYIVDVDAYEIQLLLAIRRFNDMAYMICPNTEEHLIAFDRKIAINYKRKQSNY